MIEKRFTTEVVDWWKTADQTKIVKENGKWIDADDCASLLNELHEERNYFERKKEEFLSKWSIANAENIQLRQENEKLKKDIKCYKRYVELFG